ncbi:MAG: aldehyde dehydrogenase family protein [Candidatus Izemoplasmataceae bacterium]
MKTLFERQRKWFFDHGPGDYAERRQALLTLRSLIVDNERAIQDALYKDLGKSGAEAYATEIGYTLYSLRHALKHLKRWMKRKKVKTPYFHGFTKSWMQPEALGTVLVLAPFNYPFQLLVEPLIGALAAGNTVILKPSEMVPNTEKLLKTLFETYFDPSQVALVCGGKETAKELTKLPFDHIFFTGSSAVGKKVYESAARNLVPVTLELGGKSPTIVTRDADLATAARRIVFGKFINAGQTCIAPDHVYVERSIKNGFMIELKKALDAMYPIDAPHMAKILNEHHFERLQALIDQDKVVFDYHAKKETLTMTPVVMDPVDASMPIMQEEIFGPILPVLTYEDLDAVISTIKKNPKPLALYIFAKSKKTQDTLLEALPSGSAAVNDTITQVANVHLPFGGVGQSGFGRYHGKYSFDTFSHYKTVTRKGTAFDPPLAYPPYTEKKKKLIRKVFK